MGERAIRIFSGFRMCSVACLGMFRGWCLSGRKGMEFDRFECL